MRSNLALPLVLGLFLSACVSGGGPKAPSAPTKAKKPVVTRPATRAPGNAALPKPKILSGPGLEGVIGATPDGLVRQFGPARLDVWKAMPESCNFRVAPACSTFFSIRPHRAPAPPPPMSKPAAPATERT